MSKPRPTVPKVLKVATISWFVTMAFSQLLFVFYILKFYGGNAINGTPEVWRDMTIKGHVDGDSMGNFVFATHLIFAVILTVGGLLQLIPQIRSKFPKLHRYTGRIYISTAVLLSLGGLYLIWVRDATLSMNGAVAISINTLLILVFSFITIREARNRRMESHRKWALRTFIVVSGVWFFRIGFMAWILIHQDAKWSTENLDGPFDLVWAFANYLLPLALLELYFFLSEKKEKRSKYILATILFICTILVAVGTLGSYLMMWEPNL